MLKESLVEPDFLVRVAECRRDYRDFLREFSLPSPRVFGNFPKLKNFRKQVWKKFNSEASESERMRLEELLGLLSERRVDRETSYNGELSFQENLATVEEDHFKGVCFLETNMLPESLKADVISLSEFRQGLPPFTSQVLVKKVAGELCETLREFVRLSSSITLIDPFFSAQPRFWSTFILLLEASIDESPTPNKTFEVMFDGDKQSAPSCQYLLATLSERRPDLKRKISKISFKDIRACGQVAIHNRYLLSELGGIYLGHGFAESHENENDDVHIMAKKNYHKHYGDYVELGGVTLENEASTC